MNYTCKNIVPSITLPTRRLYVRNIFISLFSVLIFSISVKVQAQRCIQSVAITANQTLCQNTATSALNSNITSSGSGSPVSASYQWYSNAVNNNTTGTAIFGATSSTYTPPTTTAGTLYYYVIATNTNGAGTCVGGSNVSNTVTIIVNTSPAISTQPSSQVVCTGTSGTFNVVATGTNLNYQWKNGATNVGTNSSSYATNTPGTYSVVVSNTGCTSITSSSVTLSNPSALGVTFSNPAAISGCTNYNPPAITANVTGGLANYTYQWNLNGSPVLSNTTSSTSNSYNPSGLTTPGTYNYTVTVTDACNSIVTSATKTITITADPAVTTSGATSTCINSAVTFSSTVTGGVSNTYEWQSSSDNSTWSVTGTATAGYSPSISSAGTMYYRLRIPQNGGLGCNQAYSNVITFTVNPLPTAFSVTGGGAYCSGGTGVAVGLSNSQSGVNYQLLIGGVTTGSPVAGTGSAISFGNQTAAGTYTVLATNSTTTCTATMTGSAFVSINPSAISNNDITLVSGSCTVILKGTTPVTSCCSYTYQWYSSSTNASAASYSAVPGATGIDYTPISGSQNNWYYRMVICADGTTSQSTSTIHSHAPLAAITSQTNVACYGGNTGVASIAVSDGNPQYTYQWTNSSGTVLLSGTSNSNSGFTATINNLVAGTYIFTVTDSDVPQPCTQTRTVIISEPAAFTASIPAVNYCSGGTNTITATATGGTPGYSYQWQNNGSNITGQTSSSYNASTTGTYTVVVTDSKGCTAVSSGAVTVSAVPTVTNTPLTQIICSGNNTALVTLTSNVNGTTFLWTANGSAGVSGFTSNGTGTIPVQTITTTGASPGTVTYTINPTGPTPLSCPGTPSDYVITVNPVATVNAGNDQGICSGSTVALTGSIGGAATSATWSGGTGTFTPNANTLNAVYTPSNAERTAGTVTLTLTTNDPAGPCAAVSDQIVITINPLPTITLGTNPAVCAGTTNANLVYTATTGNPATYSIVWSAAANTAGFVNVNNASFPPGSIGIAVPASAAAATYNGTLSINNGTCPSINYSFSVTINPNPTVAVNSPTVCAGSSTNITATPTPAGTYIYAWTVPGGTNPGNTASFSAGVAGAYSVVITNANGCTAANSGALNVNPLPSVSITPSSATICAGGSTTLTASGAASYSWSTGATSASIIVSPAATTTYSVTGTASSCPGTASATVTLNTVTAGSIGSDQVLCFGNDPVSFTSIAAATGSGTITYQWQSSITNSTSGFTDISGAINATYDPSVTTQDTWYQRIAISTLNGVQCSVTSNVVSVTIRPVTPGTIGSDQTVCSGGDPALLTSIVDGTGPANFSYQWQSSTTSAVAGFTDITGATGSTYNPPTGLAQTTWYQRLTIGKTNGVTCSPVSNVIKVTVNNVSAGTIGSAQTICSGDDPGAFTVTAAATGAGTLSYQWQSNTVGCGSTFSNIGGATSPTYDIPAGLTITTYYQLVVTSILNGVACTANSNCLKITVNPKPSPIITHN